MSKKWSITDTQKGAWTIEETCACYLKRKSKRFGCINPPLFPMIPIHRNIPDVLQFFLRITDVLLNLLITDIRRQDGITQVSTSSTEQNSTSYLQEFELRIYKCYMQDTVSFFYQQRNKRDAVARPYGS